MFPIVEILRDTTVDVLTGEPLDPGSFASLTVEDARNAADAIEALVAALEACERWFQARADKYEVHGDSYEAEKHQDEATAARAVLDKLREMK